MEIMDDASLWRELGQPLARGRPRDAVLGALADVEDVRVHKLAVEIMPGSGKPAELIHEVGIDAETIVTAALELVRATARQARRRVRPR